MDQVWNKAVDTWNITKNAVSHGVNSIEGEIKSVIPVSDLTLIELENEFTKAKHQMKTSIECMGVLGKSILDASKITLMIATDFSKVVFPTDVQLKPKVDRFVDRSQNSNASFHRLVDDIIPAQITVPMSSVLNRLDDLQTLKKRTHALLVEKEKAEKKFREAANSQNQVKIEQKRAELGIADSNYRSALSELSEKFAGIKENMLIVQKRSLSALSFYFKEFLAQMDQGYESAPVSLPSYPTFDAPHQEETLQYPRFEEPEIRNQQQTRQERVREAVPA